MFAYIGPGAGIALTPGVLVLMVVVGLSLVLGLAFLVWRLATPRR